METKKRRNIYITDENYKKVAAKAIDDNKKTWKVIDEILKEHFSKSDRRE